MSHAHNPNTFNMNVGNILGNRASVAQSQRFREQMRGSSVMAAMTQPDVDAATSSRSRNRRRRNNQVQQQQQTQPKPQVLPEMILTHRGGQRVGGTVWENKEYWEKRKLQKKQTQRRRRQSDGHHNYDQNYDQQYQAYQANASVNAYQKAAVPRLSLNTSKVAAHIGKRDHAITQARIHASQ